MKYTYGEPGAPDNRAGRIVVQEDASGAQEFFYGPLGEVVKNIRTIVIPQHDEQTYTTQWEYDTWNRLTSMTYADGEKVTCNYNSGGLLRSMTGKKKGATFSYVNQLGYDKFEQRVYLEYGNGTKTTYTYEPDRRRLETMTAQTKAKRLFMDNVYGYDKVNNIKTLVNKAPIPSSNLMGGASTYSYDYDDLYRLTTAEGSFKGSNEEHTYTLSMDYNSVGGITHKTQVHKKGEQEHPDSYREKTTYDLAYGYGETQPHAPIHIGDQTYTYDANGNQTGWTSDVSGQERRILWDEENRIRSIYDNGSQHHYVYDASGERVLKGKTTGQRIFVNGEWKAGSGQMGNYTVYVNPYLVLKSGGYTKHYYIEGQRIVSKLGGGWDNKNAVKAGGNKVDYVGKTQEVFDGIVKNLKFLGADGQVLTAGKSGKVPPGQVNGSGNVTEAFRYFYHPDHLGSTSYVTDASGEVYQHLEYFAFGETFVEEHSNTDRTPYLFNGKELDEETGLYYYGARYYDARSSVFQSVDPMVEKFIFQSPYAYAANNPITFHEVNGEWPGLPSSKGTHYSFRSGGIAIGIGFGVVAMQKEGYAWDRAGKTQFTTRSITTTGTHNNNAAIGAEASLIDFGYKYDKRSSFLRTVEGASVDFPGPGLKGTGIKGKLGVGGSISENSFEITLGLGAGAAVVNNSDEVVQSISLSRPEANRVAGATDVWFETWDIDKSNISQTEDGRYSTTVTTKNTKGEIVDTGVRVYTDNLESNMWYSEAYKKKSDSLND